MILYLIANRIARGVETQAEAPNRGRGVVPYGIVAQAEACATGKDRLL